MKTKTHCLAQPRMLKNLEAMKLKMDSYSSFNNCHVIVIPSRCPSTIRSVVGPQTFWKPLLRRSNSAMCKYPAFTTSNLWLQGTNHGLDLIRTKCPQPIKSLSCDLYLAVTGLLPLFEHLTLFSFILLHFYNSWPTPIFILN